MLNLIFIRMPGESYRRRLRSLLLCLCGVFGAPVNSLVCLYIYINTHKGYIYNLDQLTITSLDQLTMTNSDQLTLTNLDQLPITNLHSLIVTNWIICPESACNWQDKEGVWRWRVGGGGVCGFNVLFTALSSHEANCSFNYEPVTHSQASVTSETALT